MAADAIDRLRGAERILVVGPSGAGKTQLALELGRLLALPVVHLDAHRWQRGWIALSDEEWQPVVAGLTQAPAWIMDGTYEASLDVRIPAADAVIVLEAGRLTCLSGLVRRRMLERKRVRPDAPAGQRLDRAFLRYLWRYHGETRPLLLARLREHGDGKVVVLLRGRRAARRLLAHLS